MDVILIG